MLYWIPYAFVRISVFFIAGIILGIYFPDIFPISYAAAATIFLVAIYFLNFYFNRRKNRTILNPGLIGLSAVLLAGYCNVYLSSDINDRNHIGNITNPVYFYSGVVSRYGQEKEKTWKQVVSVTRVFDGHSWLDVSGDVLIYLPKASFPQGLQYGDQVLIKGSPAMVSPPANPGEFDHKQFLTNKNIYHQHFVRAESLVITGNDPPSRVMQIAIAMRLWADGKLNRHIKGEREQAIASALVLGVSDGLDQELMGAYAATGALHVLSVSGLHVGILYLIIMIVLKPLLKLRKGEWIVAALSLLMLWIYACVTGLSPSVLRAVTMFSFMVVARPLNQRTNIYNVLAASAFLLLLSDPFLLLSVGFQLSFLAVLGIVYVHPLLYNLIEPDNRFVDEIWKITSVSVAAQLATFPLGLLYFHQFPNYFLLSNLYVLPLGFVILAGGLALLALSFIEAAAALLGSLLEFLIRILNYLIFLTESLPHSVIQGVQINTLQCIMLIALITAVILFLQYRRSWMLYTAAASILLFASIAWSHYAEVVTPRVAIYKVPGFTSIDLIESGKAFNYSSQDLPLDKTSFHIAPNRVANYVSEVAEIEKQPFSGHCPFGRIISWKGRTILQITGKPVDVNSEIRFDYIIVSENAIASLGELPASLSADFIIIDTSNTFRVADRLLKSASAGNVAVHSVWHDGAFEKTI
jgi:competence protein ComEC